MFNKQKKGWPSGNDTGREAASPFVIAIPLAFIPCGTKAVRVKQFLGGGKIERFFSDLGIQPGRLINVVSSDVKGKCVVDTNGEQITLGAEMARKILVQPL